MALSRKKNEVVPSELVDCDHSVVDRSTGSTEVSLNTLLFVVLILNLIINRMHKKVD